jgi:hypothetical protein
MRIKQLIVSVAALAALVGCVPNVMVNPEYKHTSFTDRNLNIAIEGTTVIDYQGDMDNEFAPVRRNEKIQTFICSTAVRILKDSSRFRSVNMVAIGCDSFKPADLEWTKKSEWFNADLPEYTCYNPPDSQNIWLFIEQPLVQSKLHVQVTVYPPLPIASAFPTKPFTISGKFLYWDGVRKKPIAWGYASGTYETGLGVTMIHWRSATHDFIMQMISDTPFKRKAGRK